MASSAHSVTPPLDAVQSDPRHMAWMVGTPPPLEKRVRFEDASMLRFPQNRWANSNFRSLVPTKVVSRGHGPVAPLVRAERADLDAVLFQPIGATSPMRWDQSLLTNYTDGIVVLHQGKLVVISMTWRTVASPKALPASSGT